MEIIFKEHRDAGYAARTKENANADATIAIAADFNSAGEILTKKLVESQNKTYIAINIYKGLYLDDDLIESIALKLNTSLKGNLFDNEISLNIAGNGIYTLKNRYRQEDLDAYVLNLLMKVIVHPAFKMKITLIRTGGQTGIDEAGAKAGKMLDIQTLVLCPRGWKFRTLSGQDVTDELLFKKRFNI